MTIRPGDQITLTGPSGAGKSSLLALLLRFAEPTSGRIEAGGTDLAPRAAGGVAPPARLGAAGPAPVRRVGGGEHRARRPGRRPGGRRGRGAGRRGGRLHRGAAAGLRHRRGGGRAEPVLRPAPAARAGPRVPARRAAAAARRARRPPRRGHRRPARRRPGRAGGRPHRDPGQPRPAPARQLDADRYRPRSAPARTSHIHARPRSAKPGIAENGLARARGSRRRCGHDRDHAGPPRAPGARCSGCSGSPSRPGRCAASSCSPYWPGRAAAGPAWRCWPPRASCWPAPRSTRTSWPSRSRWSWSGRCPSAAGCCGTWSACSPTTWPSGSSPTSGWPSTASWSGWPRPGWPRSAPVTCSPG